jgi:hypothetical protein
VTNILARLYGGGYVMLVCVFLVIAKEVRIFWGVVVMKDLFISFSCNCAILLLLLLLLL